MINKILPLVFLIGGLAAGVAGAVYLQPEIDSENLAEPSEGESKPSKSSKKEVEKEKTGDKTHEYLKMTKPFVIPLVNKNEVAGLATLSLSLELSAGSSEVFYAIEPKLRDSFLRVLFDHANVGGFDGAFTRPGVLDPLRASLLDVAAAEFGDAIHQVLIVDIARQDTY